MIRYTSTNDYNRMPKEIKDHIQSLMNSEKGTFDFLFGGDVFEVETLEDLNEIKIGDTYLASRVMELDDAGMGKDYGYFFLATNNAGGDIYFVPTNMIEASIILTETIRINQAADHERV